MVLEYTYHPADVAIFLTLILLEGVLSFDNAAILAAMVRKLPEEQQRKALLYGIGGAYVFRILAILSVAFIIRNPILRLAGGGYLLYLAVKHLSPWWSEKEEHELPGAWLQRFGISGFWAVVISVELADIAFALDQVVVAVALTDKIAIIIAASVIAIVFIRIAAGYMVRLMAWFPRLEDLAYAAVGFVGLKLLAEEVAPHLGYEHFHVPEAVSVGVTLSLLVVPIVGKVILDRLRGAAA